MREQITVQPMKLGIIGCGNISDVYCENAQKMEALDLVACADLIPERAQARATEFDIPAAYTPEELLADPEIELVLNLTTPKAHAEVALTAIDAGKHIYNEKPLAIDREKGRQILEAAEAKGVRVGCAPDTFLGAGLQTCRKLIDDGWIGKPIGASAFFTCHGHEHWHPDPEFLYEAGGGPMLDMGPYYVTALATLMGPVRRVTGSTSAAFSQRTITSEKKRGKTIDVQVATHAVGILDFVAGGAAVLAMSFDIWAAELPRIEIYGERGTLSVPDPNTFDGPARVWLNGDWKEVPLTHSYRENSRGLGVADMAAAIRSSRPHRASGELAFHVLDIMEAVEDASRLGKHIDIVGGCERPAPMPMHLRSGQVDV